MGPLRPPKGCCLTRESLHSPSQGWLVPKVPQPTNHSTVAAQLLGTVAVPLALRGQAVALILAAERGLTA